MPRMGYKQAAPLLGISTCELYRGLVNGRYPGYRVGGPRGRWIVSTEQVHARMEELMLENVRNEEHPVEVHGIRKVDEGNRNLYGLRGV